jgi:hypothetical protein
VSKYREAQSRNVMASLIITKPNDMMVRMMFPGAGADGIEFGEGIQQKARALGGDKK